MDWTKEDNATLLSFKDLMDSDDVRIKNKIKKILLNNRYIIHVLNNKELEEAEAEADEYYGVNIFPYYIISPTQHNVQNFLCYEVSYRELDNYNSSVKYLDVIFYILCEEKTANDGTTGIARHDLLSALIQDQFNYTNYFGNRMKLISNVPSVVDSDYACRTMTFQIKTDNNLVKSTNGIPRLANKDIVQFEE